MAPEKLAYLFWDDFMEEGRYAGSASQTSNFDRKHGFKFTLIDPTKPVHEQGQFDVLLCKCNRYTF